MKARSLLVGICLAVLAGSGVVPSDDAAAQSRTPSAGAVLTAHAGTIVGTVKDGSERPVPAARLRLRELSAGRILMTTRADQEGRFQFAGVPAGGCLVELVDEDGRVLAVSPTLAIAPSETVTTVIRMGARVPWYSGFFTNAGLAAVSSAAGLGVTAVGSGMQPASGRF